MSTGETAAPIAGDMTLMLNEVKRGLCATSKTLPCKLFYDQRGSQLFDEICEQPEYYPTRTELAIMRRFAPEMAERIGPRACIIEPGGGSLIKIRLLIDALTDPVCFVPTDISADHLQQAAAEIQIDYPALIVCPVEGDYTQDMELPEGLPECETTAVYFPGSTIGNFTPEQAVHFLENIREWIEPDGGVLIGVDVRKDVSILEPAYNDAAGVTAQFNLNILNVINESLDADFDSDNFRHRAVFNDHESRIEMKLISLVDQDVSIADQVFHFDRDEVVTTEFSYKRTLSGFADLVAKAGLHVDQVWQDDEKWFSVQYLTCTRESL